MFIESKKEPLDYSGKEVIKHTSTIHCSNNLSLLQRKISNVLLYQAYSHLLDREEHRISIKELCEYLGYKGHNTDAIKTALKALISSVVEWNVIVDGSKSENWTASSIIASANITGAICTYTYSSHMRKLLYKPSMYGKINLLIQSQFTSSYGLALYENCIRYKGLKYTKEFSIDIFRKIMGVPEDKYLIFRDFKRRVLNKAVNEVNKFSDLYIEAEIRKKGRQVVSIKFLLKEKEKKKHFVLKNQSNNAELLEKEDFDLKKRLVKNYSLTLGAIEKLILEHGTDKVERTLEYIESSPKFLKGQIHNLSGYLIDALDKNYQGGNSSARLISRKQQEKEKRDLLTKKEEAAAKKLKKQYESYYKEKIDTGFNELSFEDKRKIIEKFEESLADKKDYITLERLKESSLEKEGLVKSVFRCFLQNEYIHLFPDLISFDKFSQRLD